MSVKERPIIFSGPMVRAILDGRKTQTRRVVKSHLPTGPCDIRDIGNGPEIYGAGGVWLPLRCPYGKPGDRLWTLSGWSVTYNESRHQSWWSGPEGTGLSFVTHGRPERPKRLGNQPSIHMPRWVAQNLRLPVLEVTDVRVERVQEISHADAVAEGIADWSSDRELPLREQRLTLHQLAFSHFWDSINAARGFGWDVNPWVWVISFRRSE